MIVDVTDDILPDVEKYVCTLYIQTDSAGINAARYDLFRLAYLSEALPPKHNCFKTPHCKGKNTRFKLIAPLNGSLTRLLQ